MYIGPLLKENQILYFHKIERGVRREDCVFHHGRFVIFIKLEIYFQFSIKNDLAFMDYSFIRTDRNKVSDSDII